MEAYGIASADEPLIRAVIQRARREETLLLSASLAESGTSVTREYHFERL